MRTWAVVCLALVAIGPARGDVVHLAGGGRVRGVVVAEDDQRVQLRTPLGLVAFDRSNVERIEREKSTSLAQITAEYLRARNDRMLPPGAKILDTFEGEGMVSRLGTRWRLVSTGDSAQGRLAKDQQGVLSPRSLRISYRVLYGDRVGARLPLPSPPADLASYRGLYFRLKGSGPVELVVACRVSQQGIERYVRRLTVGDAWKTFAVGWTDLTGPSGKAGAPAGRVEWIAFEALPRTGGSAGRFWIEDLALFASDRGEGSPEGVDPVLLAREQAERLRRRLELQRLKVEQELAVRRERLELQRKQAAAEAARRRAADQIEAVRLQREGIGLLHQAELVYQEAARKDDLRFTEDYGGPLPRRREIRALLRTALDLYQTAALRLQAATRLDDTLDNRVGLQQIQLRLADARRRLR